MDADVVIGVPDSGIDAALGYARESKIPYGVGFIKNRYIGRTFIKPTQEERESALRIKLNAMREAVAGVYAQSYIEDLLYLLIYVAIALFIGIVLRKPCIRIMKFFNKRLEDTDLII